MNAKRTIHSIEPLTESQLRRLAEITGADIVCLNRNAELTAAESERIRVLICRDRDDIAGIVNKSPNLKMLFIVSVGVEKLPFALLLEKEIIVANTGGANAEIMSQYAMGVILAKSTRVFENVANQQRHFWKKFQCVDSLEDKTLLIVGAGRTGRLLAKKAKAFGMRCVGVKRTMSELPEFDSICSLSDMKKALPKADFVCCTIPVTDLTRRLFDKEMFRYMKPNSYFINISRGSLIVQEDLRQALLCGQMGGAALDVFDTEPLLPSDELWDTPNLYLSPHSSGRLEDFMDRAIAMASDNIAAFLNGTEIPNLVDLKHGY